MHESSGLLGGAQPVIPPNLYSLFMNIKAWGPQVSSGNHALKKCLLGADLA